MASISDKVTQIRQAVYGKDVRESIASGIEAINEEVESTTSRQDVLETTFKQLIINAGNSNAEIVAARVDANGTAYPTLGDRLNNVDSQLAERAVLSSGGDVGTIWIPPAQPALNEIMPATPNYDTFLNNTWETLRNQFPDYVTREVLGLDESGTYNIYKYVFEPKHYEKTIILGSGIHGVETVGMALLYRFMYHVCNNYKDYPQLNYVREKVRVVVIPVQNPWGYVNKSRYNANGVDINRNFNYKWDEYTGTDKGTAPLSELETQYIDNVLASYPGAVGYVDIHNTAPKAGCDYYVAVSREGYNNSKDIFKIMEAIAPSSSYVPSIDFVKEPISINHAIFRRSINAISAEMVPGAFGETAYSSADMTNGLAFIANIILYLISQKSLKALEVAEPKAYSLSANYTAFTTTSTDWVEVPNIAFTITPKCSGIILLTGSTTLLNTDAEQFNFAVLVIQQTYHPTLTDSLIAGQQGQYYVYAKGARVSLPLNRVALVIPKHPTTFSDVTVKLFVKTTGGTLQHVVTHLNIIFIPTNSWAVEEWYLNSSGQWARLHPN